MQQETWRVGRGLSGLTSRDFSKCCVCEEPFPEIVGYLDPGSNDRRAMHLRCSLPHPRQKKEVFFEEPRIMGEID